MDRYIAVVILLRFAVNLLLLVCADRILGYATKFYRIFLAALVGAGHAGACMLPGFSFLGNGFWCFVFLCMMALMAYGLELAAMKRLALFVLLSAALGSVAMGSAALSAAGMLALICLFFLRGKTGKFAEIEVNCRGRSARMLALKDTGNLLTDPVTGEQVIVMGAAAARKLLDLSPQQLTDPIGTMASGVVVGLRLIPYRAVGQSGGMLLAIKPDSLIVDKQESKCLIAFAPNDIGGREGYEALTGG